MNGNKALKNFFRVTERSSEKFALCLILYFVCMRRFFYWLLEIALQRSESRPQHSESRVNIGNQGKPRKYGARRLCFPCRVVSTSRADWWHPVRRADSPRPRSDATSAPTAPPQNESEATAGIQAIANLNAAFNF